MHSFSQQTLIYLEIKINLSGESEKAAVDGERGPSLFSLWVACCLREISAEKALPTNSGRQSRYPPTGLSGRHFG